jgi:hypothetical protein
MREWLLMKAMCAALSRQSATVIKRFILLLALLGVASSQSSLRTAYQSRFENDVVAVYELDLLAHASASPFEAAHDSFWVSLTSASVTFSGQQDKTMVQFEPGDVRFFPSFETKLLTDTGSTEFRGVMVALKPRALISSACECTGNTGKTLCGCKGAGHLESLWAFSLGDVTLAGTSLAAGEGFRSAAPRDDMLLVAVTDLQLEDEANSAGADTLNAPPLRLKAGEAAWIRGGRHQLKNVGNTAVKFVTFEF